MHCSFLQFLCGERRLVQREERGDSRLLYGLLRCSCVAVVLQLCCSCVAVVLQLEESLGFYMVCCVAVLLQLCCSCVAVVLQLCCSYRSLSASIWFAADVLQLCFSCMLQSLYCVVVVWRGASLSFDMVCCSCVAVVLQLCCSCVAVV